MELETNQPPVPSTPKLHLLHHSPSLFLTHLTFLKSSFPCSFIPLVSSTCSPSPVLSSLLTGPAALSTLDSGELVSKGCRLQPAKAALLSLREPIKLPANTSLTYDPFHHSQNTSCALMKRTGYNQSPPPGLLSVHSGPHCSYLGSCKAAGVGYHVLQLWRFVSRLYFSKRRKDLYMSG